MALKSLRPIVLCGPSGSGKSTLLQRMMREYPDTFGFSVSHTTRKPRPGEVDGVHYHFTTKDQMLEAIRAGRFLEHATFSGNTYGTSKAAVEDVKKAGKICVLDIDTQGVKQVKQTDLNPWLIFIEPPSLEVLEARLRARKTETEDSLAQRLNVAREEMEYGKTSGNFHVIITNDDLDEAYDKLKKFLEENVFEKK
ncbi:unnamed protein product [Acanthoscelides obtectus]|nr:unnamed protein product [Acanthoscelides obtectus]CAK1653097.1 Guanylate kinase [Acanthoscelides obtectus]